MRQSLQKWEVVLVTNAERAANYKMWQERIRDLEASGLGVREWCEVNGVKMSAVYYWRRKFREEKSTLTWAPVEIVDPGPSEGVIVRVGSFAVEVQPGFEPSLLSEVVLALLRLC